MNMIHKTGGVLVSVLGVSTAAGVPVVLKHNRGGQSVSQQPSLVACENSKDGELVEVKYGQPELKKVCGKGAELNQVSIPFDKMPAITDFLQDNGIREDKDGWGLGELGGTRQCMGDSVKSPGVINTSNSDKREYLGLCEGAEENAIRFFKKKTKDGSELNNNDFSLGTCDKDCGSSEEKISEVRVFTQEKEESGKEMKFFKSK